MECNDNIVVPTLPTDPCNGKTINAGCVIDSNAYTLLEITANSTQQEINVALVLALNAANTINNAQQLVIEDLEARIEALENP